MIEFDDDFYKKREMWQDQSCGKTFVQSMLF
jgi:hypothetical protein